MCEAPFDKVFPRGTDDQEERFLLLNYAYIGARYHMNSVITEEELKWLAQKVVKLHELTERVCEKEIASVARRKSRAGRARHLWVIVLTMLIKTLSYRIPTTIPPKAAG